MGVKISKDKILFSPGDISSDFRPVGKDTNQETYIMGTFNPGMTRLKNNNILLMVRVAEALKKFKTETEVFTPRMDLKKKKFVLDSYPRKYVKFTDPRHLDIQQENNSVAIRLTSISWLLPIELTEDGLNIVKIHYNKAIFPSKQYQEFGIEDPRIVKIKNKHYMTVVGVSSNKICSCLYQSNNGLDYALKGLIFDHQNKDVVLFPDKIKGRYAAFTRPEGAGNIAYPYESKMLGGQFINVAYSPDLTHWAPSEGIVLGLRKGTLADEKLAPSSPPVLVNHKGKKFWLLLFHGVKCGRRVHKVGIYRTFTALLDRNDPTKVIRVDYDPFLEFNPGLEKQIKGKLFLKNVIFTTGIIPNKDDYIICSGEADTAVRMTIVAKKQLYLHLERHCKKNECFSKKPGTCEF